MNIPRPYSAGLYIYFQTMKMRQISCRRFLFLHTHPTIHSRGRVILSLGLIKFSDFYRAKYRNPQSISLNHFFDESGSWIDKSVLNDWEYDLNEENLSQDNWETFLEDCLELLPDRWKILMKLYYLQEEKATNICQEIGITTTNLWKILQRSRLQIRECIEQKI